MLQQANKRRKLTRRKEDSGPTEMVVVVERSVADFDPGAWIENMYDQYKNIQGTDPQKNREDAKKAVGELNWMMQGGKMSAGTIYIPQLKDDELAELTKLRKEAPFL